MPVPMRPIFRLFTPIFALFLLATTAFSQINSDFASNDEGWTTPDAASMSYSATGGNPAGYLSAAPFFIATAVRRPRM